MAEKWRSEKLRRPRVFLQPYVDKLTQEISEANPDLEFHLGGSWRRGAEVIGDLDILIVNDTGTLSPDLLSPGVRLPTCVTYQRRGDKVANGDMDCPDGPFHIDIWSCKPNERGAYLCFITGPMQLNLYQRMHAKRSGMALSQIGLLDATTKQQLDDGTERNIYDLLGLRWLEPEERQAWVNR